MVVKHFEAIFNELNNENNTRIESNASKMQHDLKIFHLSFVTYLTLVYNSVTLFYV